MTRERATFNGQAVLRPVMTADELQDSLWSMDSLGWCLECGTETDGVEPDARNYRCDECGMLQVYGMEELLMMSLIRLEDTTEVQQGGKR
jgi:hypothetical protein